MLTYCFRPGTPTGLESPLWQQACPADIEHHRPEGSNHRPRTVCHGLYDDRAIYLRFTVEDRYVRSVHRRFQDPVYRDSCVEFFVQPAAASGYFNFEMNAGGTLHVYYVEDPCRNADGSFAKARALTPAEGRTIRITSSMPPVIDPEITTPVQWQLFCTIPFATVATVTGNPCAPGPGWRGNFHKLGSGTSHPHWVTWAPIGPELNFHAPTQFGTLAFA